MSKFVHFSRSNCEPRYQRFGLLECNYFIRNMQLYQIFSTEIPST